MNSTARDVGTLLGLNGWGVPLLYALFSVTYIQLSFFAGHLQGNAMEACALVLILGSGAVASARGPYPLPLVRVAIVFALLAFGVAAANSQLPPFRQGTFADWHFGAANFILFALALRGRIGSAWLGMGLVLSLTMLWSILATSNPLLGIDLMYGQTAALVAGTFFAILLRRTATRIRAFQDVERHRIAQEHLASAAEDERARQLTELRALAEGPLSLIARGDVTESARREFLLLEATLRDRIRARSLCQEPITSVVQDARRRGSEVVLLEDLAGEPEYDLDLTASQWATARIVADSGKNITLRLSQDESGELLTYVAEGAMPQILRITPEASPAQ